MVLQKIFSFVRNVFVRRFIDARAQAAQAVYVNPEPRHNVQESSCPRSVLARLTSNRREEKRLFLMVLAVLARFWVRSIHIIFFHLFIAHAVAHTTM